MIIKSQSIAKPSIARRDSQRRRFMLTVSALASISVLAVQPARGAGNPVYLPGFGSASGSAAQGNSGTPNPVPPLGGSSPFGTGAFSSNSARAIAAQANATYLQTATAAALAAQAAAHVTFTPTQQAQINAVPNGLVAGGLFPAVTVQTAAAIDTTGLATWQGATLPAQTTAADGTVTVVVHQNDSRALLSWNSFNIGAKTTLNFDQASYSGTNYTGIRTSQPSYTVLNRVANSVAPSTVFGSIKADGTVLVINNNGILFGAGSQVNTHSFFFQALANTVTIKNQTFTDPVTGKPVIDIGDFGGATAGDNPTALVLKHITVQEDNLTFLQRGPFIGAASDDTLAGPNLQLTSSPVQTSLVYARNPDGSYDLSKLQTLVDNNGTPVLDANGNQIRQLAYTKVDVANAGTGVVKIQTGANITTGAGGFINFSGTTVTNDGVLSATQGQVLLSGTTVQNNGIIQSAQGYVGLTGSTAVINSGILAATTSATRRGVIGLSGADVVLKAGSSIGITADDSETITRSSTTFKPSVVNIGLGQSQPIVIGGPPINIGLGQRIVIEGASGATPGALVYAPGGNINIGSQPDNTGVISIGNVPGGTSVFVGSGAIIDASGLKDVPILASRNSIEISPLKRNELRDTPNYREVSTNGGFTLNGATVFVDPRLSGVRADGVAWVGSPLIEAGSYYAQVGVTASELLTKGGNVTLGVQAYTSTVNVPFTSTIINVPVNQASAVVVQKGATIDISGGFVTYQAGLVNTSKLLTSTGQVVDISQADPNGQFVGLVSGFADHQDRWGAPTIYANPLLQGGRYEAAYSEGRDAGSLTIKASSIALDGTLNAGVTVGSRQALDGKIGTNVQPGDTKALIYGDTRALQAIASQLPSGGYLDILARTKTPPTNGAVLTGGGDINIVSSIVTADGTSNVINNNAVSTSLDANGVATVSYIHADPKDTTASTLASRQSLTGLTDNRISTISFTDAQINAAGLSQLSLNTTGSVRFDKDTTVNLNAGGALNIIAGRSVHFDGTVYVPSGKISADTKALGILSNGSVFTPQSLVTTPGALFSFLPLTPSIAIDGTTGHGSFDIEVSGLLSTRGLFSNDSITSSTGQARGKAYTNGGSVSLTVLPSDNLSVIPDLPASSFSTQTGTGLPVSGQIAAPVIVQDYVDVGGSIDLSATAKIDVSGGAYISTAGVIDKTSKGGNVSLINETTFILQGSNFRTKDTGSLNSSSVNPFIPRQSSPFNNPAPSRISSHVAIDPNAQILSFGFNGGGALTLETPLLSFYGSSVDYIGKTTANAITFIPNGFIQKAGFATLNIANYKTALLPNFADGSGTPYFINSVDPVTGIAMGSGGYNAVLETPTIAIGAGQVLALTQSYYSNLLSVAQSNQLLALPSTNDAAAGSIGSVLAPSVPGNPTSFADYTALATQKNTLTDPNAYYRKGVNLNFGGLVELDVTKGGLIYGDAESSLTVPKLYNEGNIRLVGGTITQLETLPTLYVSSLAAIGTIGNTSFAGTTIALNKPVRASTDNAAKIFDLTDIFVTNPDNITINISAVDDPHQQPTSSHKLNANLFFDDQLMKDNAYLSNGIIATGTRLDNGNVLTPPQYSVADMKFVYFLGNHVGQFDGAVLASGSATDLSGLSLRNPSTAPRGFGDPTPLVDGKLIGGGTLRTIANNITQTIDLSNNIVTTTNNNVNTAFSSKSLYGSLTDLAVTPEKLVAQEGAIINLSGASDSYDRLVLATNKFGQSQATYAPTLVYSNAGLLLLTNGGSLTGAVINAFGGAAGATGGTLEIYKPTLYGDDAAILAAAGATPTSFTQAFTAYVGGNAISASAISTSGFDAFIGEGTLDFGGSKDITLSLGRSAIFRTATTYFNADSINKFQNGVTLLANQIVDNASLTITNSNMLAQAATISAPYIRFESKLQSDSPITKSVADTGKHSVTFAAKTIDAVGATIFDQGLSTVNLTSAGDVRFIGVERPLVDNTKAGTLAGQLLANGNLNIAAAQLYPTTGSTFVVGTTGLASTDIPTLDAMGKANPVGTINISRTTTDLPSAPFSAGGDLLVQAVTVNQGGVIRAPLGSLRLGGNVPFTTPPVNGIFTVLAPVTASVNLLAGSLTSVSANGLRIPYGVTTDQIEYFFAPTSATPLTAPPAARLTLAGSGVNVAANATIDVTGGGDLYAYEFASGVGGSRDVLSRINNDVFSGNVVSSSTLGAINANQFGGANVLSSADRYQYADGRAVYAIVPSLQNVSVAPYDPYFSGPAVANGTTYNGNYANLYSANVGQQITFDTSPAPGVAAGTYTLLPAQYATLQGGLRVVENVGAAQAAPGQGSTVLDGSVIVGGYYGTIGTGQIESTHRSFTVENQATFSKFSSITTTSDSTAFSKLATRNGLTVPRLPVDAGRLVINSRVTLGVDAAAIVNTAPGAGGRSSQVDVTGQVFDIVQQLPSAANVTAGTTYLTYSSLNALNAGSLLIGGTRSDDTNGNTYLNITANALTLDYDSADTTSVAALRAPEILLVVDGGNQTFKLDANFNTVAVGVPSFLTIKDGASIQTTGTFNDSQTGQYLVGASGQFSLDSAGHKIFVPGQDYLLNPFTNNDTGYGSVLRVSNGPVRTVSRASHNLYLSDPNFGIVDLLPPLSLSTLTIGAANISGDASTQAAAVVINTSGNASIDDKVMLSAKDIAIGSNTAEIAFTKTIPTKPPRKGTVLPLFITPGVQAALANADHVTLSSPNALTFAAGSYNFKDLTLDAPGLAAATKNAAVTLTTGVLSLGNSGASLAVCTYSKCDAGVGGTASLTVLAKEIDLTSGSLITQGFANQPGTLPNGKPVVPSIAFGFSAVSFSGAKGIFIQGIDSANTTSSFNFGSAAVALNTPYLGDRTLNPDPTKNIQIPTYALGTTGTIAISNYVLDAAGVPVLNADSSHQRLASVTVDGVPGSSLTITSGQDFVARSTDAKGNIIPAIPASTGAIRIDGTDVRATAGILRLATIGDTATAGVAGGISVTGGALVETPGYSKVFGKIFNDTVSAVTVSAPGGALTLNAGANALSIDSGSHVSVDGGTRAAGSLILLAAGKGISFGTNGADFSTITSGAGVAASGGGNLTIDSGSSFNLGAFANFANHYTGDINIRSNGADETLAASQTICATSFSLTNDGGAITIAGSIDTSGKVLDQRTFDSAGKLLSGGYNADHVNGGNVALYGLGGVTLAASGTIDTHTEGYQDNDTRQARAGNVTLGTDGTGAITINAGGTIDAGARRSGKVADYRLVSKSGLNPDTLLAQTYYTLVNPDLGGKVTLRAPILNAADPTVAYQSGDVGTVNINYAGTIIGAGAVTAEGFRRYNLDQLDRTSGYVGVKRFTGLDVTSGNTFTGVVLDPSAARIGNRLNFLSDSNYHFDFATNQLVRNIKTGAETLVDYIQTYNLNGATGLGALTSLTDSKGKSIYHAAPGYELVSAGNIGVGQLAKNATTGATEFNVGNWNLGAGAVDLQRAYAAGDVQVSFFSNKQIDSKLTGAAYAKQFTDGSVLFNVLPTTITDSVDHNSHIFNNFTSLTYRVGGRVDGDAGVLSLRAGGTLDIQGSITDGFFNFHDQTNRAFASYSLGGGNRTYAAFINTTCTAQSCGNVDSYQNFTGSLSGVSSININLNRLFAIDYVPGLNGSGQNTTSFFDDSPVYQAPFSVAANAPGAVGSLLDVVKGVQTFGDAVNAGQLFPLLQGKASNYAASTSYQLVGGAAVAGTPGAISTSINPLTLQQFGAKAGSDVIVEGLRTYTYSTNTANDTNPFTANFSSSLNFYDQSQPGNPRSSSYLFGFGGGRNTDPFTNNTPITSIPYTPNLIGPIFNTSLSLAQNWLGSVFGAGLANPGLGSATIPGDASALTTISLGAAPSGTATGKPLNGNQAAADFLHQAAASYFGTQDSGSYTGFDRNKPINVSNATTIVTSLDKAAAFIDFLTGTPQGGKAYVSQSGSTKGQTFTQALGNQLLGYGDSFAPTNYKITNTIKPLIRTGTGNIDVTAARDINLTNGAAGSKTTLININIGGTPQPYLQDQIGGNSIYTAGHLIDLVALKTVSGITIDASANAVTALKDLASTSRVKVGFDDGLGNVFGFIQTSSVVQPNLKPADINGLLNTPVYLDGGGDVTLSANRSALSTRESLIHRDPYSANNVSGGSTIGDSPLGNWHVGQVGQDTELLINTGAFYEGVAALGGGVINIKARHDISDLSVISDTSVTTGLVTLTGGAAPSTKALWSFGGGDVHVSAGNDIIGGRFDVASGVATISAGRNITAAPGYVHDTKIDDTTGRTLIILDSKYSNNVSLRLTDATIALTAGRSVVLGDRGVNSSGSTVFGNSAISSLGEANGPNKPNDGTDPLTFVYNANPAGFYTPIAGVSISSNDAININSAFQQVLPGSFRVTSVLGDIILPTPTFTNGITLGTIILALSPVGQLSLLAGRNLAPAIIAMDDSDPNLEPGALSAFSKTGQGDSAVITGHDFVFPSIYPNSTDATRRLYHNQTATHLNDPNPVRIFAGNTITSLTLNSAKQTQVIAGRDLIDTVFVGQNLHSSDVTRIAAGRDITSTQTVNGTRTTINGNNFTIGGPGLVSVEAGRDAGPFQTSATVNTDVRGNASVPITNQAFAGGILTVGNEYNPWLTPQGAALDVQFGVGPGTNYASFQDKYLNPANLASLGGEFFAQTSDSFGNKSPIRSQPIYYPVLLTWLQQNGYVAGNATPTFEQAYAVFAGNTVNEFARRQFLLNQVYFNELTQVSIPDSPSFNRPARAYNAVSTLFPASFGYTNNSVGIDPAQPVGPNNPPVRIETGNLDLRLATLQTARGGDISLIGPGGRVLAGSLTRTETQAAKRGYKVTVPGSVEALDNLNNGPIGLVLGIPTGFEGILTLRGGAARSFTDGDFLVNQSRLFTEGGGYAGFTTDAGSFVPYSRQIVLFSANGDVSAGQGPKTSSNAPPVVLKFDPNGYSEVDAASAVSGAGVASFKLSDDVASTLANLGLPVVQSDVFLIALRGTVDAGDAGVRVAGNVFVAANKVANADNFQVSGQSFGLPTAAPTITPPASQGSALADARNLAGISTSAGGRARTRVIVDVLGYAGDPCDDTTDKRPADCPAPKDKGGNGKKAGNK